MTRRDRLPPDDDELISLITFFVLVAVGSLCLLICHFI